MRIHYQVFLYFYRFWSTNQ